MRRHLHKILIKLAIGAVLIAAILLVSCESGHDIAYTANTYIDTYLRVVTIRHDGCEYVICRYSGSGVSMLHKPLCDNPAHKDDENEFTPGIQQTAFK